jgi:HSP20 family protein
MKTISMYDPMLPALRVAGSLFGSESPFDAIDRFLADETLFPAGFRNPVVDVRETAAGYEVIAELPGLSEKDLRLELKDDLLSLSAESKKEEDSKEEGKFLRRERRSVSFSRSFVLPEDADSERIEARFKDGLLTVTLPRKPEAAPRIVPVNAA